MRVCVHLLVAALYGAVSLWQVHHIAVCVCDELNFNVSRVFHKLLHKEPAKQIFDLSLYVIAGYAPCI
jgi:hypothetical protein